MDVYKEDIFEKCMVVFEISCLFRSRDIVIVFVGMEVLNYILIGGFFFKWKRMVRICLYLYFLKYYRDFLCIFFFISY